jgi:hypothetical protein
MHIMQQPPSNLQLLETQARTLFTHLQAEEGWRAIYPFPIR